MDTEELIDETRQYYETGALKYEGRLARDKYGFVHPCGKGTAFFADGTVYREGEFIRGGLLEGREYYPNGQLKFEGRFFDKRTRPYYGPTYPVEGRFYGQDGTLLYEGKFQVEYMGSTMYPKVIVPEGYGSLK